MYVHMYVCMYVCMYVYMYVYMYSCLERTEIMVTVVTIRVIRS